MAFLLDVLMCQEKRTCMMRGVGYGCRTSTLIPYAWAFQRGNPTITMFMPVIGASDRGRRESSIFIRQRHPDNAVWSDDVVGIQDAI